jgi:DNA-binding MarR family transcriptional regulator
MPSKLPHEVVDRNLGFLVSDVHRLITTAVDKEMKELGLTRSQLRVILHLVREDGLTQVRIADDLQLGKVTVGGLLDRLEVKQLVERRPHPTDRRATLVYLTDNADELIQPMQKSGSKLLRQFQQGMSKKEQQQLIDLLLRVKDNTLEILAGS